MSARTRRILVGIVGVISFLVNVLGALSELPDLIRDNISSLPKWVQNPKFVWVATITTIYGIFALIMWPHRKKKSPVPWMQEASDRINAVLSHLNELANKYNKRPIKRLEDLSEELAGEMCKDFGNDLAAFIGLHLGARDRDGYQKRLLCGVTAQDPKMAAAQTAIVVMQWVTDFMTGEIRRTVKQALENVKLDIADYAQEQFS